LICLEIKIREDLTSVDLASLDIAYSADCGFCSNTVESRHVRFSILEKLKVIKETEAIAYVGRV
jgi:hypothetical protein